MTRIFFILALFTVFPTAAAAQDMPLSQILIDGEGWKKVEGKPEKPKRANPRDVIGTAEFLATQTPLAAVRSASGDTIFVSFSGKPDLWAFPANEKGIAGKGGPYCPLRHKGHFVTSPHSLAADRDGRIYATTTLGIQVFDPTGRLCGVIAAPTEGASFVEHLKFEGDTLTVWIGNTKYARKLNTQGTK